MGKSLFCKKSFAQKCVEVCVWWGEGCPRALPSTRIGLSMKNVGSSREIMHVYIFGRSFCPDVISREIMHIYNFVRYFRPDVTYRVVLCSKLQGTYTFIFMGLYGDGVKSYLARVGFEPTRK